MGRKSHINYFTRTMKNYIYFDKGYHKDQTEKIHLDIRRNCGTIFSLDEEGVIDYEGNQSLLGRYSTKMFTYVDHTFFWGKRQYETVKSQIPANTKYSISGHPRFELLKPAYHYLYAASVKKLTRIYGNFILINTNMGSGNNLRGDDFVFKNYGERLKNIREIVAFDKQKRDVYIELIKGISSVSDRLIILRPHPEEDIAWYKRALIGLKNVRVIYQGSVIPWLLAADVMIHPDCTTAIESLFLGKKAISFLPENSPTELIATLPVQISNSFKSVGKLIEYLMTPENPKGEIAEPDYQLLEEYFNYSENSIQIILDQISSMADFEAGDKKLDYSLKDIMYLRYQSIRNRLKDIKGSELSQKKLSGLNKVEVFRIRDLLVNEDTRMRNVKIKRITNELFYFGA